MAKDTEHVIFDNVARSFASKSGDKIECRSCGAEFVRGDWCFHALCDACFSRFDSAKMASRVARFFRNENVPPVECVEEWMARERS